MPYVPKNLFPRNTAISNNGEYVSFLGNIDEHDYIENVYLNIYDEKGQLVAKVDNAKGIVDYPLLNQTNETLGLGTSTKPPYNYSNNQIKLDIPITSSNTITISSVTITSTSENITVTLKTSQEESKEIVFDLSGGYLSDLRNDTVWHTLDRQDHCTLYGICDSFRTNVGIISMRFKLKFDNYELQNNYYLNGSCTFTGSNKDNNRIWRYGNGRWHFLGCDTINNIVKSLNIISSDIGYYLNQDKVNWSFTLKGRDPDVFIQEGVGISSETIGTNKCIIIENGEFIESGQYFNDVQFEVVSGTEYFYFLEVLSVNQNYDSGSYKYTITFPQILPSIDSDTCQLTLGTNIITTWKWENTVDSTVITFTSSTPYLTPNTDVTMSIAVELKRIKTKLLSTNRDDFNKLVEAGNLFKLSYKIMSKKMSSPTVSYKNISNFDNNLIHVKRLNTKQCRVYSSYSDTFFTHTKFTLQDANGKTIATWELDKIKLDEIIDNLSNQEYTLIVEYTLKNELSNIQEITIPTIVPSIIVKTETTTNGTESTTEETIEQPTTEETESTVDPYAIIVSYDTKRQANKIEVPYYTTTNGVTTYVSIYKKTFKDGALCNQTLVLSNQTMSEKLPSLLLYDYGISFGHGYEYEALYTIDELETTTDGSEPTTQASDSTTDGSETTTNTNTTKKYYEPKPSILLTIEEWVGTALYGVKYDYENNNKNRYELDPDNIWYFDLDTQSNIIDFTNERNIFLNLSPIPKVGTSATNYMTQSITTKLGYLDENDIYVEDNGWKLNKFAEWSNDGFIKILRLRNGYLIPVDIQLKNNTINYSALGEPSDITFTWTQVKDHKTTSLYSFD